MFAPSNRRRQRAQYPIGLDVGSDAVKLLQLRTTDGVTEVAAAARVELPAPSGDPQLVSAAIRTALKSSSFAGRRVVAALPHALVHVRTIRVSAPSAQTFDPLAAAEREAALSFPFPLTSAQVGFLPAGEVRQAGEARHEVIAAAAADRDVTRFLEMLARAGVEVEALEFEPAALYRALERAVITDPAAEQQAHVLLDIGACATRIVIGRGRDICVVKTVNVGTRHIAEAVATRLAVSTDDVRHLRRRLAESDVAADGATPSRDPVRQAVHDAMRVATTELLEQVVLCLRYYSVGFRGRPASKVWLSGGGADAADFRAIARAGLGLPVEPLPLMNGLSAGFLDRAQSTSAMGEWGVALGLALRDVHPVQAHAAAEVSRA